MQQFKETLLRLEEDAAKIQFHLSQMISSESRSSAVIEREIDGYMCEVETLCVRSRIFLDGYRQTDTVSDYGIPSIFYILHQGSTDVKNQLFFCGIFPNTSRKNYTYCLNKKSQGEVPRNSAAVDRFAFSLNKR